MPPDTEIEEFLLHYSQEHPLRQQGLGNYALLVKNQDYHLYSVEQANKPLMLKVMCDPDLFYAELAVFQRLETLAFPKTPQSERDNKVALRLQHWF